MTKTRTKATSSYAANSTSRKDTALALLRRDGGATLDEIVEATGWLRHSARAVFTGLRRKGYAVEKQKVDGSTHYTITAEPAA
jgi:predicted GNAT superfamily acetyltransferase